MENKTNNSLKQSPENLVLEFFDRVWHKPHELDAIDELMTEDYVITTAGKVVKGRAEFKKWVGEFQKQLLDSKQKTLLFFPMTRKIRLFPDGIVPAEIMGFLDLCRTTDLFPLPALPYGLLETTSFPNVG